MNRDNNNIGGNANPNQQIVMSELLKTQINLSSYRNSGYMQVSKDINNFSINAGTRGSYWTYNEELILSPRASIAYAPLWEKDFVFSGSFFSTIPGETAIRSFIWSTSEGFSVSIFRLLL